MSLCKHRWIYDEPELTKTGAIIAKLSTEIGKQINKIIRRPTLQNRWRETYSRIARRVFIRRKHEHSGTNYNDYMLNTNYFGIHRWKQK